jgi:hypothetical protein
MSDHYRTLKALNVLLAVACLAVGTYLLVDYLQDTSQAAPRGSEAPTTTPVPTTTPAAKDAEDDKDLPAGAIVGIAIGSLFSGVVLFLVSRSFYRKRLKKFRLEEIKRFVREEIINRNIRDVFTAHKEEDIDIETLLSKEVTTPDLSKAGALVSKSLAEHIEDIITDEMYAFDPEIKYLKSIATKEEIDSAKRMYAREHSGKDEE